MRTALLTFNFGPLDFRQILPALAFLTAAHACAEPPAHPPLTITRGGTYTGAYESLDPKTPAIRVATSEPVIIEHADLRSRSDLIRVTVDHAHLTIRDCHATALNPNVPNQSPGRFLTAEVIDQLLVEHNLLEGTAGIYLHRFGRIPAAGPAIRILANEARNIDGRRSDGRDGFLTFNTRKPRRGNGKAEDGFEVVQFVQLDQVQHVPGIEIAWNLVTNQPGASRVEDNISIYQSSGTKDSPILIHDNFIQGAYTVAPCQSDTDDATYHHDWSYSGGGIMAGDGAAKDLDTAPGFIRVTGNHVVGTTNYGIAVSAGHDVEIAGNRILSCGRLPDGRAIAAQNVGLYLWDANGGKKRGTFFAVIAKDNTVGWAKGDHRNDWWIPDATAWENNRAWPDPLDLDQEKAELALWRARAAKADQKVGPRP